jgi:molecular chaperone IbpA
MTQLTRFDTASLNRALVGFDRLFDDMERRFANSASSNYPPYNIAKISDNLYNIVLAVAGFSKDEISVHVDQDQLIVTGNKLEEDIDVEYLHRGLAFRDFERKFMLADHVEVKKAEIKNGLLSIILEREIPEALLPRKIDVIEIKD